MEYQKVQEKYPDSLSQYDMHKELTDVNRFGPLGFGQIERIMSEMAAAFYELELINFRESLFESDANRVNDVRATLIRNFKAIQGFDIKTQKEPQQQQIVAEIESIYKNQYPKVDDILLKMKLKELLKNPQGKELDEVLKKAEAQSLRIQEAEEEVKKIVKAAEEQLEEAKKGTEEAGLKKGQIGSIKMSKYYEKQAVTHKVTAEKSRQEYPRTWFLRGWKGQRSIFFFLLIAYVVLNLSLYAIHVFWPFKVELFTPEYGILSGSFLLLLYVGMSFATNNYTIEKQLETDNQNRSNVANTLELFLATPQTDESRAILLQEAAKTIFAPPKATYTKEKIKDISTPISEVRNIIKEVKE